MKKMKKSMWLILLFMAVLSTNAQVGKGLGGSTKSGYCTPAPTSVDGDGITNVTFSTVNNTTTAEATNYGDYSTMIGDVQQTATVPISITFTTAPYSYDATIWIDWNDDLDFADAGEEVFTGSSSSTLSGSFLVPITAVLGHHRMRIGGQDDGPCDPCYTGSYGTYEDYTINVTAAPSCVVPTSLISSNVTTTTADIAWTGDVANYNVDYRIAGAATWTSSTTATNSIALTSLNPSSTYEVRVQKDCGGGDLSAWSAILTFNTLCTSITSFPYTENFEGTALPNCWSELKTPASSYGWSSYATGYAGRGVRFDSYDNAEDNVSLLKTQVLDLTSLTSAQMEFWWKNPTGGNFKVMLSTDGGATFTNTLADNLTAQSAWILKTIDLSAYVAAGNNVVIGFEGTSNWGSGDAFIYIDDLTIDAIPTCVVPTAFAASNITTSSIDISWTGTAANYRVQYRETGAATWTYTDLIAANTTTISGLATSQSYDFQVRAICSVSDSSALTSILVANTTQIPATVPYSIDFESGATNWTIVNGTEANYWVAGTATANGGTQSVYITNDGTTNDYDITTSSVAHLYRDITFTPSTIGYTLTFDWKANGEGVSSDYDNLKVFLVDVATTPVAGTELTTGLVGEDWYNLQTTWQNGSISLPATLSGTTKRLVFSWVNDGSAGTTPPAAIDNVSIVETTLAPCETPTALVTTNVAQTTADLGWTSTAANFNVRYRTVGATTWTSTTASTTTLALTSLTASTQYEFQVQAVCSATAGDTSYWANAVNFTTLATPTCPDPTALVVSAINASGASLSWTNGGTETAWNIRFKKSTDASYTNVNNTTTKPYVLSALQANSAYVWSVQAICSITLNSGWATDNAFTTTVGVEDNALANLSVYSHNNQINVLNNGNTLVKEVVIYDMLGQQVGAYAINSNENILINTNLTVGNYVIKVVTEKQVMTKKLLVKQQ